jgi:hypothetical protein
LSTISVYHFFKQSGFFLQKWKKVIQARKQKTANLNQAGGFFTERRFSVYRVSEDQWHHRAPSFSFYGSINSLTRIDAWVKEARCGRNGESVFEVLRSVQFQEPGRDVDGFQALSIIVSSVLSSHR